MHGFGRNAASADDLAGRFAQAPHVLATAAGSERVLLDLKGERYYTLNEVGSRLWALLGPGATVPEMVATIGREYDGAGAEQVERDVRALLAELLAAGLAVRASA